jgi:putative glutamine amidotransferase
VNNEGKMAKTSSPNDGSRPRIAIPEPCGYDPAYSARTLPPYLKAIEEAGGEPVVIPLGLEPEELARRITGCAAVLLPGNKADVDPQKFNAERHPKTSAADPQRDAADELLLQDAYNLHKPIFGICYGLQSLNVWRTGSLLQHIESQVAHSAKLGGEMAHRVVIEPNSLLARDIGRASCPCAIAVNSSHHQSAAIVGDGLRVTARCPDDGIIEAIEGTLPGHYVLAVQWHPERTYEHDEPSRQLFSAFIQASRSWRLAVPNSGTE